MFGRSAPSFFRRSLSRTTMNRHGWLFFGASRPARELEKLIDDIVGNGSGEYWRICDTRRIGSRAERLFGMQV